QEKTLIEDAFPGDVIGLYDTGNFKIGDTLTEGETIMFQGIPNFSPEFFKEVINADPMKAKQLAKGIRQLTDEGVAQLFTQNQGNRKIIGTVGELQFDVVQYRLLHEYGASCSFKPINFFKACWITSEDKRKIEAFCRYKTELLAVDKDGNLVFFAESKWRLESEMEDNPEISFHFTSEFKPGGEQMDRCDVLK
ncbi:MAG: hypothetical protein MUO31_05935, partial [Thermodesulfovibrionales bacterium]|nr:hypothetical protein [Thermodesulfovibrionales bacterium]